MRGVLGQEHRSVIKNSKKLLKNANLAMHVGSLALAIECLEELLTERGILRKDELMDRIQMLAKSRYAEGK